MQSLQIIGYSKLIKCRSDAVRRGGEPDEHQGDRVHELSSGPPGQKPSPQREVACLAFASRAFACSFIIRHTIAIRFALQAS